MTLSSSDAQANSVMSVMFTRLDAYQSAILALTGFHGAGELQGDAYESGKAYGLDVLVPLIRGAILLSENLGQATSKLPSKYRSEVWREDLDSEKLESDIVKCERSLVSLQGAHRLLEKSDDVTPEELLKLETEIYRLMDEKERYQELLNKLMAFDGNSNSVFDGMNPVAEAMNTGLGQIQTSFANFDGEFHLPSAEESGWINTLNGAWAKRDARIEKAKIEAANKVKKAMNESADEARKAGKITDKEHKDLLSKINKAYDDFINISPQEFAKELITSVGQDYVSNSASEYFVNYILPKSPAIAQQLKGYIGKALVKYGLIASIQSSGTPLNNAVSSTINSADNLAGNAANSIDEAGEAGAALAGNSSFNKHLPTAIGSGLDFTLQVYGGEDVGDAAVKTVAHTGISLIGQGVGKVAGAGAAALSTYLFPLSAPYAPAIGAAVDTTVSGAFSFVGSSIFDNVYEPLKEEVTKGWDNFVDAFNAAVFD